MIRRRIRGHMHSHGIGRHTEAENNVTAARAVESLAQMLGDNKYFMGPTACGVDATVFAFVAGTLCKTFDSPMRTKMEGMNNLVAYSKRMFAEFYPDFAKEG